VSSDRTDDTSAGKKEKVNAKKNTDYGKKEND
jgi:hypothetical protein